MSSVVLLDALGTLVGLREPWPLLRAKLLREYAIDISQEQAMAALGAEMVYYRAECHRARDSETLAALRLDCAEVLARELGGAVAALDSAARVDLLLSSFVFEAYPEVRAALELLSRAGTRLAVVSNWDISLHDVLQQEDLSPYLSGVFTSAEVGATKPSAEIFAAALSALNVGVADCIHVGDSAVEDVGGAQALGIEGVLLQRAPGALLGGRNDPAPAGVRTITSLLELAA